MNKLLTFFCFLLVTNVYGQHFYTNLCGFRIGQYRETTKAEFSKLIKTGKYDDGFEYEVYLLNKSDYIAFEYAADNKDVIWSIQVSGTDGSVEIGFRNLKLGMT